MSESIRQVRAPSAHYDPLPLETDPPQSGLYAGSPVPPSPSASPGINPMDELPPGAGRPPRFQGPAAYDGSRVSLASDSVPSRGSAYDSVYALNPAAGRYHDNPSDVYNEQGGRYGDAPMPLSPQAGGGFELDEKRAAYVSPRDKSRRKWYLMLGALGLLLVIAAVVIPLYLFVIKKDDKKAPSTTAPPSASDPASPDTNEKLVVTGGDGSEVTMEDGTKFTYRNQFGGTWYWDPNDPFNNGARAQEWTPALNETFKYGIDTIKGVNIGGWLNTEPFISPALYEQYENNNPPAIDEWTLSVNMRADNARGGIQQLEEHYKTFISERDFAEIAGAGLNFIRLPLPYWAIETRGDEPFLEKTCWTYFLKAIQWARKYGLRINLDFHALPGSQNGWNHSGKFGTVNFLNGPMGFANAQRSLDYIRIIAQFISQPQYRDVVVMFGIMNEPQGTMMGEEQLHRFYMEAYNIIRKAGGTGEGNGPFISYHDGFFGQARYAGFMPGADRISLDIHPYMAFGGQSDAALATYVNTPCGNWAAGQNTSMADFGLSTAGEFSLATNDCGLFLNGVGLGSRYEGAYEENPGPAIGPCEPFLDWQTWDANTKDIYRQLALSSMDALQNYFFWTWKIGNSSQTGTVRTPQWSYQLGLENGWIPADPREAVGACGNTAPFVGPLQSYQTGGAGAGQIPADVTEGLAWPPPEINNAGAIALLPSYTPTGTVQTLPGPAFTTTSGKATGTAEAGNGWNDATDTAGAMAEIAGCTYPDPWIGPDAAVPPVCAAAAAAAKRSAAPAPEPLITPAPL